MKLAEHVKKLIKGNDFDKAYSVIEHFSIAEKVELLFNQVTLADNTSMYLFLLYLISRDKDIAEWHYRCFVYLVFESSLFNDSMYLASWHARNALNLDNGNLEYIKTIFSVFVGYPEQFFTCDEFKAMATTIVHSCTDCAEALEYLNK